MRTPRIYAALLVLAVLCCAADALGQTGGGYDLTWNTIDGGGSTFLSGGTYSIGSTIGQPDAGNHAMDAFTSTGGFWFNAVSGFTVYKDFSDVNASGVTISLNCSPGVVSPPSAVATESIPASFTVTGYTGAPTCTATEAVPAGYTANETGCVDVPLSTGECTIVNTVIPGTITVVETTTPSPDPSSTVFHFVAGGGLSPTDFTLTDGNSYTFNDVVPGSGYSITQLPIAGWMLTSATCSDGSLPDDIDVDRAENITCTFAVTQVPPIPAIDGPGLLLLMVGLILAAIVALRGRRIA